MCFLRHLMVMRYWKCQKGWTMWRTVPSSGKPAKTPRVSASWSPPILTASALKLFISFCVLSLLMPHYGCSSQTCRAQKKRNNNNKEQIWTWFQVSRVSSGVSGRAFSACSAHFLLCKWSGERCGSRAISPVSPASNHTPCSLSAPHTGDGMNCGEKGYSGNGWSEMGLGDRGERWGGESDERSEEGRKDLRDEKVET